MFEQSELRSRREERMENGVKNLKGSEAIPQYVSLAIIYSKFGDAASALVSFSFIPR
jgi:hypothetical protein